MNRVSIARNRSPRQGHGIRAIASVAVSAALALLASACSTATTTSANDGPRHPMRAENLRDVMRSFDEEVRRNVPGEIDEHDRWEGIYPRIADAAAQLEASAKALAGDPPEELELPDRGRFQVLGRSLADAAAQLKEAAARSDADSVAIARRSVAATCRDCHSRFRKDNTGIPEAFE